MSRDDLTFIVDELTPDSGQEIADAAAEYEANTPDSIPYSIGDETFRRMPEPWECVPCSNQKGGKLCGFHQQVGYTPRNRAERRAAAKRAKRSARA